VLSLEGLARAAQDSVRTLERALVDSRSHWYDSTRRAFDQRHGDVILDTGQKVARELEELAGELGMALASLPE